MCDDWKENFASFAEYFIKTVGWKETTQLQIDRVDNDKGYEPSNIRLVDNAQNSWNTRAIGGTSKLKGVWFDKRRCKWESSIKHRNKKIFIGRFDSEEEAGRAYDKKAKELRGEYTTFNFE